jgi:hypothetical protein
MPDKIRTGGCLCGAVRYELRGEPFKSGLCHCTDCRKITGSSFLAFADWRPGQFSQTGPYATYQGRSFCPHCGSRVFSLGDDQVEIYLGSLDDAPGDIAPEFEGWCTRRENWLPIVPGLPMYPRDP